MLDAHAKNLRRGLIVRRVAARKKSEAMRRHWEERRRQQQEFLGDDYGDAGSADSELADLPDALTGDR